MTVSKVPMPQAPFVDPATGFLTRVGTNFLNSLTGNANAGAAGSVTTAPGSGLAGGGSVADGISLIIGPNGVSNAMIRQSLGTSVIGRMAGSSGNVADIQATADDRVLARQSGQLVFSSFLNAISIGPDTAAPVVRCDAFEIVQSPVSEVVVCTHTITISVDGTDYKIPIVAA